MNYIFFTYGTIGEMLMDINLLSIIHDGDPKGCMYVLTLKNTHLYKEMVECYPFIEILDARNPATFIGLFFGKNIVIRQQISSATPWRIKILCRALTLLPGSTVIAFSEKRNNFLKGIFTDKEILFNPKELFFDNLMKILPLIGLPEREYTLSFDFRKQNNTLTPPYAILHPIAGMDNKTAPIDRWVEVVRLIRAQWPSMTVYVTGGSKDAPALSPLAEAGAQIICGELSFQELAQVIVDATFYLGADTGITHLASMVSDRAIVWGHNAFPTWLPRYNKNTIILSRNEHCICSGNKTGECYYIIDGVKRFRCMMDVSNSDILEAIKIKIGTSV